MAAVYTARQRDAPRVRRPGARGAWIWVSSAAYVLAMALNIAYSLSPPRLSLALSISATGQARVAWMLPGGALWERGIRPGDAVLALDGRPPSVRQAGPWTGRRVRVRAGAGAIIEATAAAGPSARTTWPLLLLSPWFLLLATLVVLRAPRRAVGRSTYLLFASAAFALALAPGSDAENVAAIVAEWTATALFAAGFVGFFLTYPTPRGASRLRAWLPVPPLVGALLGLAAFGWPALYGAAYGARMAILLGYLFLGVGLLVWSALTVRDPEARRGLAIIGVGTVASILPFAALYLLPTVLGRPPLGAAEQVILALGFLPASMTYAILRHNTLDVHLFQRWLVHGLLWVGLLAPFGAVVFARHWALGALTEPGRTIVLTLTFALLAGLVFGWLRDRLRRLLDRLIFKDSYDYRASLQRLSRDLSLAETVDTLGTALPTTLRRLMNLDFAALLVRDTDGVRLRGAAGSYQEAMLPALVEAARDIHDAPRLVPLVFGYLNVLLIPLCTHDAVVGHLCLGPKASGEPFRAEDHTLLATLSGHLAAIVRNSQLVDDLRGKVQALDALNERLQRTQEEERARLAADLHDEPLQTALALQRQIAIDGFNCATTARHVAASQDLIAQLRALCTAMRPAALDHLGLHAALDQLARERGARAGFPITLDADPEVVELDVPAAAEIVLYRATQEALTNCVRHARPRAVRIVLRRQGAGVSLVVADDGAGFVVPDRLDDLVGAGSLGLAGLRARVQHAGGHCRVISAPGEGTIVQVDLPLGERPVEVSA